MDIIASGSFGSGIHHFGLVIAPLTFSVQILSLLVLLTLFVFVPLSIVGTIARLAGLRSESKSQGTGGLVKSVASRFFMYTLYHLAMFGIWFLLASVLIGHLYQPVPNYIYAGDKPQIAGRAEVALNKEAAKPTMDSRPASPTDSSGITNTESNQLQAPLPNDDGAIPRDYPQTYYPPNVNRITPSLRAYPIRLSDNPYPPYDPIYTKTDILSVTYLLITIYTVLFVSYIAFWAIISTNVMYYLRKHQGKKPFKPTLMLYARLIVWNAVIFGVIALIIHQHALY